MSMKVPKTSVTKPADTKRSWYVIDASTAPLGRIATKIARLLSGKGKPTYTPHVDDGDFVVVINADKLQITGRKKEQSKKYRHSGYPGSIKETKLGIEIAENPEKTVRDAVYGMVPKNKLRDERMKRLKVYAGSEHPHSAQQPKELA